jgi:hypothetical protein
MALAFRRSNDPQAHGHAKRKIPTEKICHLFIHHVINRTNGNSISARFFARCRESEIETTRKNFLDPSRMKL